MNIDATIKQDLPPHQTETFEAIDEFSSALVDIFPESATAEKSKRLQRSLSHMLQKMFEAQIASVLPFVSKVAVLQSDLELAKAKIGELRTIYGDLNSRLLDLEREQKLHALTERVEALEKQVGAT